VRLRNGRKTYVIQYRLGTQQRRESLGDIRKVRLDDARKIARQRFASVELGVDPKVQTNGASTSPTLARAADLYLAARKDVVRPATHYAAGLYFSVQWAPLRARPIAAITRAEVAGRFRTQQRQGGKGRRGIIIEPAIGRRMAAGLSSATLPHRLWEPCAGGGPMVRVLRNAGYHCNRQRHYPARLSARLLFRLF
jgi:hypothetical protein